MDLIEGQKYSKSFIQKVNVAFIHKAIQKLIDLEGFAQVNLYISQMIQQTSHSEVDMFAFMSKNHTSFDQDHKDQKTNSQEHNMQTFIYVKTVNIKQNRNDIFLE
jgi:hypothetical protein